MIKKAVLVLVIAIVVFIPSASLAGQNWQGTDDLIDSKIQQITGVAAKEPLIDISKGNLGLFLFAAGGFTAGTVFGYQWRRIFVEKAGSKND
jgi:ABC-type cobalt transport system substrate-binding protein